MSDYLAIVSHSYGGGSWARGKDKDDTVKRAARIFRSDWKSIFDIKKGSTVTVNLYDVDGSDEVTWDYQGVRGDNPDKPIVKIGEVVHTY